MAESSNVNPFNQNFEGVPPIVSEEVRQSFLDSEVERAKSHEWAVENDAAMAAAAKEYGDALQGSDTSPELRDGVLGLNTEVVSHTPDEFLEAVPTREEKDTRSDAKNGLNTETLNVSSEAPSGSENRTLSGSNNSTSQTNQNEIDEGSDKQTLTLVKPAMLNIHQDDPMRAAPAVTASAEKSDSTGTKTDASQEKPTTLEETLSKTPLSEDRQLRTVILGNFHIRDEFYQALREMGKLDERGGNKSIRLSEAKQFELMSTLAEKRGMQAREILVLKAPRNQENVFKRSSLVKVIAVGDAKTIEAKVEEANSYVEKLHAQHLIKGDGAALTVPGKGSLKITADAKLSELINVAREAVYDENGKLRPPESGKTKDKDGSEKVVESDNTKLSRYAREMPETFRTLLSSKDSLMSLGKGNQPQGLLTLKAASKLGDFNPGKDPELGKLSPEERREALTNLATLAVLGKDGAFVNNGSTKESVAAANKIIPEIEKMVARERTENPEVWSKPTSQVNLRLGAGTVSSKQAEQVMALMGGEAPLSAKDGKPLEHKVDSKAGSKDTLSETSEANSSLPKNLTKFDKPAILRTGAKLPSELEELGFHQYTYTNNKNTESVLSSSSRVEKSEPNHANLTLDIEPVQNFINNLAKVVYSKNGEKLKTDDGQNLGTALLNAKPGFRKVPPGVEIPEAVRVPGQGYERLAELIAVTIKGESGGFKSRVDPTSGAKAAAEYLPHLIETLAEVRTLFSDAGSEITKHVQNFVSSGILTKEEGERGIKILEGRERTASPDNNQASLASEDQKDWERLSSEPAAKRLGRVSEHDLRGTEIPKDAQQNESAESSQKLKSTTAESNSTTNSQTKETSSPTPESTPESSSRTDPQQGRKEPTIGPLSEISIPSYGDARKSAEHTIGNLDQRQNMGGRKEPKIPEAANKPDVAENSVATQSPAAQGSTQKPTEANIKATKASDALSPLAEFSKRANSPTDLPEKISAEAMLRQALRAGATVEDLERLVNEQRTAGQNRVDSPAEAKNSPPAVSNQTVQTAANEATASASNAPPTVEPKQVNTPVAGSNLEAKQDTAKETKTDLTPGQKFIRDQETKEAKNYLEEVFKAPQRNLLIKDKVWNVSALERVTKSLAKLDPTSIAQNYTAQERMKLVENAKVFLDNAARGAGVARSDTLREATSRVEQIAKDLPANVAQSRASNESAIKLGRVFDRMAERQIEHQSGYQQEAIARNTERALRSSLVESHADARGITPAAVVRSVDGLDRGTVVDAQRFASGLVQAAYKGTRSTPKQAMSNLRRASRISFQALRGMPVGDRARAAVALNNLASRALHGGEYGELSLRDRDIARAVESTAVQVGKELQAVPGGQEALNQSYRQIGITKENSSRLPKHLQVSQGMSSYDKGPDRFQELAQGKPQSKSQDIKPSKMETARSSTNISNRGASGGRDMDR